MNFKIQINDKSLNFDSGLGGLIVNGTEYIAGKDGRLIYDQTRNLKSDTVTLQMSTNTSTLIPSLWIISLPYNSYFDQRDVVESQNDITFYWNKSRLAAFYNRFSTDEMPFEKRETVIRKAVNFLIKNCENLPLRDELLDRLSQPCKLLGFYRGFPIFDSSTGFAKLQSRLGIHVDPEEVMISTPMDRYEKDVYELAVQIASGSGGKYIKKKNRVRFPKTPQLLRLLGVK